MRYLLALTLFAAMSLHCSSTVLPTAPASAAATGPAQRPPAALFRESFDDPRLLQRGWYDGNRFTISSAQPRAGNGCIEYTWKAGTTNPATSTGIRHLFVPADSVYLRFYIRLSRGWGWTGRDYHPHLMHFMTTENQRYHGPAASHLTVYIEPQNGKLRLAAQDIQNKDMPHGLTQGPLRGGFNGQFYDSQATLFRDDGWHCVEAIFRLNSLDLKADKPNADGMVRGWFDGKLVIDRTDVVLRSTDFPRMKFNQFLLTPYFGPGLLPHEQTLWIDELAVGTDRLRPIAAGADTIVQQLRDLPTPLPATGRSDGSVDPVEQRRLELYRRLRQLGDKGMPALSRGLRDPDVRLRRNVALALNALGGGWFEAAEPKLDIRGCLPALIKALQDPDGDVSGWAAQAIGEIGPGAARAVPALVKLLKRSDEGSRNSACIALGGIGPAAKKALPALRKALGDSSADVRRFARPAIDKIGAQHTGKPSE